MKSDVPWFGCAAILRRTLIYEGAVGVTDIHRHHAFQLVLAADRDIALIDASGNKVLAGHAVIPPNAPHALESATTRAVVVLVDPDDVLGRQLRKLSIGESADDWVTAGMRLQSVSLPRDDASPVSALLDEIAACIEGVEASERELHPAVQQVLSLVQERIADGDVRLAGLAQSVNLSASRLSHLFAANVGIPLRSYVLWTRMSRAAEALSAGMSLTEAAHHAGFSDGAHLSNTFRHMFGLAPSQLVKAISWNLPQ